MRNIFKRCLCLDPVSVRDNKKGRSVYVQINVAVLPGKDFFFFVGLVNSEVIKRHILYQKHAGTLIETFFFFNYGCLDQFTRISINLTNSKINNYISFK
jgi:hypothetical protein